MSITIEELQAELERIKSKLNAKDKLYEFLQAGEECILSNRELANLLQLGMPGLKAALGTLHREGKITIEQHGRIIRPIRAEE